MPDLSHERERELSADPVALTLPRPRPERRIFHGRTVSVEPIGPEHAADLFAHYHADETAKAVYDYLPYGPFADEEAFAAWLAEMATRDDPVFYAFRRTSNGRVEAMASLMEIVPAQGRIEIGHINISTAMQNSIEATEGLWLLMQHAMDDLGNRRFEWKCHAFNAGSRAAAARLGFSYEGIFYNHSVVKGRNRDTAWFSILDSDWPLIRANFLAYLDPENFDTEGRQKQSLGDLNRAMR
ncbi:MAG TPA: GNAT family protein [Thermomicrobiales bacterium]|nr:GNAT family protein [Thermomicrobiales bacterium]